MVTSGRLLKIIVLFCKILSLLQGSFAKETCNFKEPTHGSHSIPFYLGLFFEIIHEPLSLEEGTLAEDNSLQAQAYLVLDRREEVRQAA